MIPHETPGSCCHGCTINAILPDLSCEQVEELRGKKCDTCEAREAVAGLVVEFEARCKTEGCQKMGRLRKGLCQACYNRQWRRKRAGIPVNTSSKDFKAMVQKKPKKLREGVSIVARMRKDGRTLDWIAATLNLGTSTVDRYIRTARTRGLI